MSETHDERWDDMVLVGIVARPHGLRGQVIVNPLTDFAEERFSAGAVLWIGNAATVTVESVRFQGGRPVIGFAGYDSIDAAAALAGRELRVPESRLPPLADGSYYHHQLVGCAVMERGETIGTVAKVDGGSAGSLLVVQRGDREVLIPLARDICTAVDVGRRTIEVALPEGLLELNDPPRRVRPGPPAESGS